MRHGYDSPAPVTVLVVSCNPEISMSSQERTHVPVMFATGALKIWLPV